ncbi:MAG: hypothetical protein M3Z29_16460 [Pseudomonadota bacterium]|nr:hypothetical protein [Pseudomonadota bacterium]
MKQQIARLSPHQNAKVAAVMMAVSSLILAVPFLLIASAFSPVGRGAPLWGIIVIPLVYLVFGYIFMVIGCAIYNVLVPFTGGIEFETTPGQPS